MIKIRLKCFSQVKYALGESEIIFELENGVFMLWGRYAKEKGKLLDGSRHLILTAAHPSPFSARNGFFGCRHFSKTNNYLKENDKEEINWALLN